ncbi:MAG: hypothetical protein EOO91_01775 [Pedobacter sp.]|nr:MAG: hypothetical protein EOO91_01775 [Pedobacter sp.]
METLNLHFALEHNKREIFIQANGKTIKLESYRDHPQKFKEHCQSNLALRMIPTEKQDLVTHFVEGLELPIDSISRLSIVSPAKKTDDILPDLLAVHMHVPQRAYRKNLLKSNSKHTPFPLVLDLLGVKKQLLTATNALDLHAAASLIVNGPLSTARSIISHHPDLGTIDVDVASDVFKNHMQDTNDFLQLINYISSNGDETEDPWYTKTYSSRLDPDTKESIPMEPSEEEFGDGEKVAWPKLPGTDTKVIPLYNLSDAESGSTSGGVIAAATGAVCSILKKVKNDAEFKGKLWDRPQGVTSKKSNNVSPKAPPINLKASDGKFIVKQESDSDYGLDLYWDKLSYDNGTISFPMRNWPNRFLSVYIEYLRADGSPIPWSELETSKEKDDLVKPDGILGPTLEAIFAKQHNNKATTKLFWGIMPAGNQVFGIPFWTEEQPIFFKWPHDKDNVPMASKANVYLGGFGMAKAFKDWDEDVDLAGVLGTGLISFGVTAASMALTIKVLGPLQKKLKESQYFLAICGMGAVMGAASVITTAALGRADLAKTVGSKLSNIVAGIMFGQVTQKLLLPIIYKRAIAEFQRYCFLDLTTQQVLQQAPFAGWALKLISVVGDIAAMAATTIQCGLSPATYRYQVQATMNVHVKIKPDPNHGTMHQDPIWPMVADHWVVMLKYPKAGSDTGGMTFVQAGPMPAKHDEHLSISFLDVPAGGKVEISAVVYSKDDWIAGRWDSGPKAAMPNDAGNLEFTGAIVESIVPLLSTTKYTERQRIGYDSNQKKHKWVMTSFGIESKFLSDFQKGNLTPDCRSSFANNGIWLPPNNDLKISTIETDKQWHILNKNTGTIYRCFYVEIYNNGKTGKDKVVHYQINVENMTRPTPPLPYPKTICDTSGDGHNICQLVNLSINNKAYQLGYVWKASGLNLPKDKTTNPRVNTQMYCMQSISTLSQPSDLMIQSKVGFSEMPFIAYNQFGLTPLFQLDFNTCSLTLNDSNNKPVPANVQREFKLRAFDIPATAAVNVTKSNSDWRIIDGNDLIYNLIISMEVVEGAWKKVISVFNYVVPESTDFYLDSRMDKDGNYHLRTVSFNDGIPGSYEFNVDFDETSRTSWGSFPIPKGSVLYKIVVHPGGYVIGIDFGLNKLWKLKLNEHASTMKDAPMATPLSGEGNLEGLISQPKGITIAADGRIIVLEEGNKRFQSFDVNGNPVAGFKGNLAFETSKIDPNSLDETKLTAVLKNNYQESVPTSYLRKMLFDIDDIDVMKSLDKGEVSEELKYYFKKKLHELPEKDADTKIEVTKKGSLWFVTNTVESTFYDLRWNNTATCIEVYYASSFKINVVAKKKEWLIIDQCNSLTFKVTKKGTGNLLSFQQLIATAALRQQTLRIDYLDVAIEDKGYIYVLYMETDGSTADKYKLDIYNPDGTVLLAQPLSGIAAAKMAVDKWRTLWTLNYEKYLGPDNRTEPTVSGWIPSTK